MTSYVTLFRRKIFLNEHLESQGGKFLFLMNALIKLMSYGINWDQFSSILT